MSLGPTSGGHQARRLNGHCRRRDTQQTLALFVQLSRCSLHNRLVNVLVTTPCVLVLQSPRPRCRLSEYKQTWLIVIVLDDQNPRAVERSRTRRGWWTPREGARDEAHHFELETLRVARVCTHLANHCVGVACLHAGEAFNQPEVGYNGQRARPVGHHVRQEMHQRTIRILRRCRLETRRVIAKQAGLPGGVPKLVGKPAKLVKPLNGPAQRRRERLQL
mmetsp:Transcript_55096/g.167444  ORF Transcript_55096/g.167444 Transcript_55096/m.167444 type:complete len:219 (+) Transcript_55096:449-1105(+)